MIEFEEKFSLAFLFANASANDATRNRITNEFLGLKTRIILSKKKCMGLSFVSGADETAKYTQNIRQQSVKCKELTKEMKKI